MILLMSAGIIIHITSYYKTSSLVVPKAFIECEVRIYDKRRSKDRAKDDEEALGYKIIIAIYCSIHSLFLVIICTEML